MKRRRFIRNTGYAAAGALILPLGLQSCKKALKEVENYAGLTVSNGSISPMRRNVSSFYNSGGTVGIVETADGFVIIDTQSVKAIQPVIDAIAGIDGKNILYVCNTHHHGDHTGGNSAFTDIKMGMVAQRKCPEYQKLRAIDSGREEGQKYADILFDNEMDIDLGEETIKAIHVGNGHTNNDVMYHMENANVVHMGDLMFNNIIPVFRNRDGASHSGWIKTLTKAEELFDGHTQFIFGHGKDAENSMGDMENIKRMRGFLEDSMHWIRKQYDDGVSLEDVLANNAVIPGHEDRITFWDSHFQETVSDMYEGAKLSVAE